MAGRDGGLFVSPTEKTIPNDPERTLAAPRFDEKSVQAARAAVPLRLGARVRSWPLAVVVTCVAVGLLGGALVGFGLTYYFRDNAREAGQQAAGDATANSNDSTNTTPAQPEKTNAQDALTDAQNSTTNTQNTAAVGSAQPSNDAANNTATNANTAGAAAASSSAKAEGDDSGEATAEPDAGTRGELQAALGDWVAATNARDINRQMKYYAPTVADYYLTRNASRASVRAEKARVFGSVGSVDVRASTPDVRVSRDGQTAVMRFRKQYQIGGASGRSGAVLQELRWRRTPSGWKIVGERDLRVLQ